MIPNRVYLEGGKCYVALGCVKRDRDHLRRPCEPTWRNCTTSESVL